VSRWKGKYVIGLTGNIGTGKSIVRKMLENLGAYGIDADALAHRAIAKGAPGYEPLVHMFGHWILKPDQQVDRSRLAKVVFSDPEALTILEGIVHPLVIEAVNILIRRSSQAVIVVEAIKLIESGMTKDYDSVWVTYSSPEQQLERLMNNRKMTEKEAQFRIDSQPAQERKLAVANVVIKNTSTYEDTYRQVYKAWDHYIPKEETAAVTRVSVPKKGVPEITVTRARPVHVQDIAQFLNQFSGSGKTINKDDVMASFGEKAFLMLEVNSSLQGLIGWQVENLISRTTDILISPALPPDQALPVLLKEMETASHNLQCEASLLFIPENLAKNHQVFTQNGYVTCLPEQLDTQTWQEAAKESMVPNTTMYFKKLRQDRVLRPI